MYVRDGTIRGGEARFTFFTTARGGRRRGGDGNELNSPLLFLLRESGQLVVGELPRFVVPVSIDWFSTKWR